jgi:hypothetical protein
MVELIELVLAEVPQIEAQSARLTELTQPVAKFGQPPKTSDNSSVPPSQSAQGQRGRAPHGNNAQASSRGVPHAYPNPDHIVLIPADKSRFHATITSSCRRSAK